MTREEMLKLLSEIPDGVDVEDYIKQKNDIVINVKILENEYEDIMDLMRAAHKRYMDNPNMDNNEYWKDVNKQTDIIRKKYNLSENINVLEWMHNKIFKS
jgi:hypothetical protein